MSKGRSLTKKQDNNKITEQTKVSKIKGTEARKEIKNEIMEMFESIPEEDKITIFEEMGIGGTDKNSKYFTCYMCGKLKKKRNVLSFYRSKHKKWNIQNLQKLL